LPGLHVFALGTALGAGLDRQLQFFGFLGRGHEAPATHGVCGEGLFCEDVLAGVDRSFKMLRPVTGRSAKHHDVNVGGQDFFVAVEPDEAMLGIHLHAICDLGIAR